MRSPTAAQVHSGKETMVPADKIGTMMEKRRVVPAVKFVTTKSAMDSAKASIMPGNTAGRMNEKVTRRNVVHGVAPRSAAASSIERSRVSSRARTTTATNEMENITCAI